MQSARALAWFCAILILLSPLGAFGDKGSYTGSGGNFSTSFTVGSNITISDLPLAGTKASLSLECVITSYGGNKWKCSGGSITITSSDNSLSMTGSFGQATMSLTASGGGKGGHTTYLYQFYGPFSGSVQVGSITQGTNGAISFYQKSSTYVTSGPVSGSATGWSSAYSPVLVADQYASRILAADNITGINLASYGSYGNGKGNFESIGGLAEDSAHRIYATDATLNRIIRIDNISGTNWVQLGTTGSGKNQFRNPRGVTIDSLGKIWIADSGNNRIVRMDDMTGKNWTTFGTVGNGTDQINAPTAIAFDSSDRIYIADAGNNRIVRIDNLSATNNWTTLTHISIPPYAYPISSPQGVAVDAKGRIYTTDYWYLVSASDMTGNVGGEVSYWGSQILELSLDSAGTIYVSGGFTPPLAQVEDTYGTGYFTGNLGVTGLLPSVIYAVPSTSPPPPAPALAPSSLAFENQNVSEPSAPQSVTLTNFGGAALTIKSLTASADYPLNDGCGTSVAAGSTCQVAVTFKPTVTGLRNSNLSLSTNGAYPSLHVTLTGTGTQPNAVLLPTSLAFDPQQLHTASPPQTVILSNTGTGPLNIKFLAAAGAYSQTNNCGSQVAPHTACTITVIFDPSATGARAGSITISDDAIPATQTIALSGAGASGLPAYTVSHSSLQFPTQKVNSVSPAQTVTLTDNSTATVKLTAPTYPAGFKGSTTCGTSLKAGASCTYSIKFAPTKVGAVTGTLNITINGKVALIVGLSGTGAAAGASRALTVSPTAFDFGITSVGDTPIQNFTLSNNGGVAVGIQSIGLSDQVNFAVTSTCSSIVAPGASCILTVTFQPQIPSTSYNATLTVNESGGGQTPVTLTGATDSGGGG